MINQPISDEVAWQRLIIDITLERLADCLDGNELTAGEGAAVRMARNFIHDMALPEMPYNWWPADQHAVDVAAAKIPVGSICSTDFVL